jgi:hypothetical protein
MVTRLDRLARSTRDPVRQAALDDDGIRTISRDRCKCSSQFVGVFWTMI